MSPLRIIGYIGLAILSVVVLLSIYLSISKGDWQGVATGLGMLVMFALFGNLLWLAGFKQKHPQVVAEPNKVISGLLFVVLGLFTGATSIQLFMSANWLSAVITLVMAVFLFQGAYGVFKQT